MPGSNVIGREAEQKILLNALRSPEAEFLAVYGRRRIGKTFLVREFFQDRICFELCGLHEGTLKDQLENFALALGRASGVRGIVPRTPSSWLDAFRELEQFLEVSLPATGGMKRVVFLDELPWLDTPRSRFLAALEQFWNVWASRRKDIVLVVCGSAASWMLREVVHARGGLHNRVTRRIRLLPFSLRETEQFLLKRGIKLNRYQIVELYLATGGVPHYLKETEPGKSAAQQVDALCFSPQGLLREEFQKLYASLFRHWEQNLAIIKAMAKKLSGQTRNEILAAAGLASGGTATKRFEELEESGFILRTLPFGGKENDALFRVSDEFSLFHLKWMAPLGKRSMPSGYWQSVYGTPAWRAWSGYAFEGVCLKHIGEIKHALGIGRVQTFESSWRFVPGKRQTGVGAQIDLIIDRKDACINLCEMKFSDSPFVIDKRYAADLRRKRSVFQNQTSTRKNLFLTMLAPHGIVRNDYATELIAETLDIDSLFALGPG